MLKELREALAQVGRLGGFVVGAFTSSLGHNLGMGLLAIALSTSIWVFIINEQNPPRTGIFPTRISVQPVNPPAGLDILGQLGSVQVRVTAPADIWDNPTQVGFEAQVDLAQIRERGLVLAQTEEGVEVAVLVHSRDTTIRILDVVPSHVLVRLDTLTEQLVPVRVNLQQAPPSGFSYQDPSVEPPQVTVLGPEGLVSLVDVAIADVNLGESRSTIKQSFVLVPRTARGLDIAGVQLEPQHAVVEVPIVPQLSYANLPVVPELQGSPALGFQVSEVRVEPLSLAVVGPSGLLQPLSFIKTLPIDVTDLDSSISPDVGLDLPPGVSLVDRIVVRVHVTTEPLKGTAVYLMAPQFLGVSAGYIVESEARFVEVTVSGEGPALARLTPGQITVFVRIQEEDPGVYLVEPEVHLPPEFEVVSIDPSAFSITIQ